MADAFALSENPQDAFAGGARDVVDVQGDDLADPRAGVERDERECLVAWWLLRKAGGGARIGRPESVLG